MSSVTGREWADAARVEHDWLEKGIAYNEQLLGQYAKRREAVAASAAMAMNELVCAMLPTFDAASMQRAVNWTGYVTLLHARPLVAMENERAKLRERLAAIEGEHRFVHREHLRDPRGGKLVLELAELTQSRLAFADTLDNCKHPRLAQLLESGYGTEAYATPFWRLSYYSDWEAGDAIVERFPGLASFSEVREAYLRARDAAASLDAAAAGIRAEIAAGEALEREHSATAEALASLEQRTLADWRARLAKHIQECGPALGPRLAAEPTLGMLASRALGLAAKLGYLDRTAESQLYRAKNELLAARARAEREIRKFSSPKRLYSEIDREAAAKRFRPRDERYRKIWDRYQQTSDALFVFDRYDRCSWTAEFLWWDAMTDGRLDGDFIPEVAEHRRRFPHTARQQPRWDDDGHLLPPEIHGAAEPDGFHDPS
ncbi:MAG: hypothetical protein FJ096_04965 [Deltaproteobacteria bacterium]|nr:hypothetical protein [Deltaproteobacteria bacterium]